MPQLALSATFSPNPIVDPLIDGHVSPEGIDLTVSRLHASEMFWRQLRFCEFAVSEMSLASMAIAASKGKAEFVAIPVFPTRQFFHNRIVVRDDSGIDEPARLAGRRVGVPEYQQSGAVWARGALQHEFGVSPDQIEWFMERPRERSHGGATGFVPPPGVRLHYIS